MKCMVLLTWHYSDSTLFINLCFAGALLACTSPRCGAVPENCKARHIFLMAISMHSDPLSPSHNSAILKAARVFISSGVIGVIEHSADSRLFLFLHRCQAWVGGVFQPFFCGAVGPPDPLFTRIKNRFHNFLPFSQCLPPPSSFFFLILICHCRLAVRPSI